MCKGMGGVEGQGAGDLMEIGTVTRSGVRRSELCKCGKGQMDITDMLMEAVKGLVMHE